MRSSIVLIVLLMAVALFSVACNRGGAPPPSSAHAAINAQNPGMEIDLAKYVVKGKTTIFDFYSTYCGPCMMLSPLLDALASKDPNVVIQKVDINRADVVGIDFTSPLAQQQGLQSIPHFIIYDASGKKVAEGRPAYNQVIDMLKAAGVVKG